MDACHSSPGAICSSLETLVPLDGSGCGACDGRTARDSAYGRDLCGERERERERERESERKKERVRETERQRRKVNATRLLNRH